ncbi:MAG TPA: hypothetical protein VGL61_16740 [Kofleriaceae bacterium]|jgi:hypothetical protein
MRLASAIVVVVACAAPAPSTQPTGDGPIQTGGDGPMMSTIDAADVGSACLALATARCTQLMTCSPSDLQRQFGTVPVCLTRETLACTDALGAADTGATAGGMIACGSAVAAEACGDFLAGSALAACVALGSNNGTCSFSSQCETGFCGVGAYALCGTCQAEPVVGTSCATDGCGQTLVCDNSNHLCEAPAAQGKTCNNATPCQHGLICVGATSGTCQPQVTTLNGACDPTHKTKANCNADDGLTCDEGNDKCVAQPLVAVGSACGIVNNVDNACTGGATCLIPNGQTKGTCQAPAADGSACNINTGPDCFTPARCVPNPPTGSAGTCQLPGTTSC